jgi:hypothetical protein
MARKNPTPKQKERLFEANSNRCCVCKENNIGLQIHHIDGDNENTIDSNLAILCTRDHDNHHRPQQYKNCENLDEDTLLKYKNSWELFINEARKDTPKILATINIFGTEESIHSMKLIMQWVDNNNIRNNRIEYEKIYHLHSGSPESWVDDLLEELNDIGKNIKLTIVNEPLDIEYCPCHNKSYSQTLYKNIATKITAEDWSEQSICTIYINPNKTSLALTVFYKNELIYSGSLHVCNKEILHYQSDNFEERIKIKKRPSIRAQATNIIQNIISTWEPGNILIGTGDELEPELIDDFELPIFWEKKI